MERLASKLAFRRCGSVFWVCDVGVSLSITQEKDFSVCQWRRRLWAAAFVGMLVAVL